eukprot:275311_1
MGNVEHTIEEKKQDILKDDNVFVVGNNAGQLCLDNQYNVYELTNWCQTKKNITIRDIHNGYLFIIIRTNVNTLFVAGYNIFGQCGVGNLDKTIFPMLQNKFFEENNIKIKNVFVSTSSQHCIWLSQNDELYANGYNAHGQIAVGNNGKPVNIPTRIGSNISKIKHVAVGSAMTYILTHDGVVYENYGVGYRPIPWFQDKQIQITMITAGSGHAIFVSKDDRLWVYGAGYGSNNNYGQYGIGDDKYKTWRAPYENTYFPENKIKIHQISCGGNYSLVCDTLGKVYAFGGNSCGQCAVNLQDEKILSPKVIAISGYVKMVKIKCGASHSYISSADGRYWLFGSNGYSECTLERNQEFGKYVRIPYDISDVFNRLTNNCKIIQEIYLGSESTWIVAKVKHKGNDISDKHLERLGKRQEIKVWLENEVNLEEYYDVFIENGFEDIESLQDLDENIMNSIGITKVGHRMKLMKYIKNLKSN